MVKNNTIALLTGIFIVVIIAGFLSGPAKILQMTGRYTSSSTASFNITEEVSIFVNDSVNFGAGRVYANASQAILDSSLGYLYSYVWGNLTYGSQQFPVSGHTNVVYDEKRKVYIMYGGDGNIAPPLSLDAERETWQFNYSDKKWTNLSPAHHPNSAELHSMVYDKSAEAIILFGGSNGTNLNETWKFNSTGDWEQLFPSTVPSVSSTKSVMTYDSKRNVSVLYSIYGTWEYNATANNWTNKTSGVQPTGVFSLGMAYDPDRNVTVLFGGGTTYTNETWEYNGTGWKNVTSQLSGTFPPKGKYEGAMVYDSLRKKIVLAGGDLIVAPWVSDKVFEYNGTGWSNKSLLPEIRHASVVFNPAINKTLLFYGRTWEGSTFVYMNDTLEYNATEEDFNPDASINGTWYFQRGFIKVENDGTVNISVNYTANKAAGQFIGGTNPSFMLKGVVDEENSCPDLNTDYSEISNSTTKNICPLLQYAQDRDRFKLPIKLVVPGDSPSGKRNSTITFTAVQVS